MRYYSVLFMALWLVAGPAPGIGRAQTVPITPSAVFGMFALAEGHADAMLREKGMEAAPMRLLEKGLAPMHAYQMAVATADMLIALQRKMGLRPMPRVVATPTAYSPEDVYILARLMEEQTRRLLIPFGILEYQSAPDIYYSKAPTDVFGKVLSLFIKLATLTGRERITPSESYMEMVRAASDARSILAHIDPARRYRIDAPPPPADATPAEVFARCIQIRGRINGLRALWNMEPVPAPEIAADTALHPADVFVQTQIIVAELNLLKMTTGTISATPLANPVTGMRPTDVMGECLLTAYLLDQVETLQQMVGRLKAQ